MQLEIGMVHIHARAKDEASLINGTKISGKCIWELVSHGSFRASNIVCDDSARDYHGTPTPFRSSVDALVAPEYCLFW